MSPTSRYEPKDWGKPPEGLQPATLGEVRDTVGTNFNTGGPNPQKQLIWKLDVLGENGQPLRISQWCNDNFHPKSKLRAVATALLGDRDPGNSLDWDDLIGLRARIMIKHVSSENGYVNARVVDVLRPLTASEATKVQQVVETSKTAQGTANQPQPQPQPSPITQPSTDSGNRSGSESKHQLEITDAAIPF
jgi:hypothetical protein